MRSNDLETMHNDPHLLGGVLSIMLLASQLSEKHQRDLPCGTRKGFGDFHARLNHRNTFLGFSYGTLLKLSSFYVKISLSDISICMCK